MKAWHEEARKLRAEGLPYAEIGRRLGYTHSAVVKACNPELARKWAREGNARPERKAAKREWDRSEVGRGRCSECDELMGVASAHRYERCEPCRRKFERGRRMANARVIERTWAEGRTLLEIAAALGWTKGHLAREMFHLRHEGLVDLPYRYPKARREAARAARAEVVGG